MSLNEEWYIIPRELEAEEIIHQNHIKHGPHLKLNPTLKEIKKFAYDWSNIEKDIRNFYFKCLTCGIRTPKPRKICSQTYRIGLSQRKIPSRYNVFGKFHFKWFKYLITVKAFVVTPLCRNPLCRNPLMKCEKFWSLMLLRWFLLPN